jgi:hypothetical protein
MYRGSGPRLPSREGYDAIVCPTAPNPASPMGGLRRCHASRGSLWAMGHKHKEKPNWHTYVASPCVSKARVHVSKTPDNRAIMGVQDVWVGSAFNACKTCGQMATM